MDKGKEEKGKTGRRTITTNAFPLKNRPYTFATNPTASAPTAAEMSLWFRKRVPVKWFVTQPMHEIATSMYSSRRRHGAWLRRLRKSEYDGTVRNAVECGNIVRLRFPRPNSECTSTHPTTTTACAATTVHRGHGSSHT